MGRGEELGELMRIAMWSGPRNLSTALMRAFEARGDCAVTDEPLYAHYLARTGLDHPHRDEVLASMPVDLDAALAALVGPPPEGKPHWFQKHMAHHVLPEMWTSRTDGQTVGWMVALRHAFLIRDPAAVVASYGKVREAFDPRELGFHQQVELLRHVTRELGQPPVVIDSADLLADPGGTLRALCTALGLPYTDAMRSWPPGRRATDGVWAPTWYGNVERSTGFARPSAEAAPRVPRHLSAVHQALLGPWEELSAYRLRAPAG